MSNQESQQVFDSSPAKLAELLEEVEETGTTWHETDLQALFRHQMTTPIPVDLEKLSRKEREKVKLLTKSHDLLLNSYNDLFTHPSPPSDLLKLIKHFAKQCMVSPNAVLPREISTVLYYASIVTALLRHKQSITKLTNEQVVQGINWCLEKEWLTESIRALFIEAQKAL